VTRAGTDAAARFGYQLDRSVASQVAQRVLVNVVTR
jgi:hypothetical protein